MQAVEHFFDWQRESYSIDEADVPTPKLARIPLGVHTDGMTPGKTDTASGPVNLLVFGRISHHSKMDLLPLVRALHRLVADGMQPETVELTLAGWVDDNDDFLPTLKDLAANVGIPLTIKARPRKRKKSNCFRLRTYSFPLRTIRRRRSASRSSKPGLRPALGGFGV